MCYFKKKMFLIFNLMAATCVKKFGQGHVYHSTALHLLSTTVHILYSQLLDFCERNVIYWLK